MELKKIEEKRYISSDELDPRFKYEICEYPGGENIKNCFQCGVCSASCPVREIDDRYNPRKIITMALLGLRERVLKSDFIWLCSTCYTCYERCPQDVRITEIMTVLRNIAVREGYIHPSFAKQVELINEYGRLYKVDDYYNKVRQRAGLPPLVTKNERVTEIFKMTRLDKLRTKAPQGLAGTKEDK